MSTEFKQPKDGRTRYKVTNVFKSDSIVLEAMKPDGLLAKKIKDGIAFVSNVDKAIVEESGLDLTKQLAIVNEASIVGVIEHVSVTPIKGTEFNHLSFIYRTTHKHIEGEYGSFIPRIVVAAQYFTSPVCFAIDAFERKEVMNMRSGNIEKLPLSIPKVKDE